MGIVWVGIILLQMHTAFFLQQNVASTNTKIESVLHLMAVLCQRLGYVVAQLYVIRANDHHLHEEPAVINGD